MASSNTMQHKANLKRFAAIQKKLDERNKDVDGRFTAQDLLLKDIKSLSGEARDLAKKTNGRVTNLEDVVAPINSVYQKFKIFCGIMIFVSPLIVSFLSHIFDQILKMIFH
jgi:hypothetical protein